MMLLAAALTLSISTIELQTRVTDSLIEQGHWVESVVCERDGMCQAVTRDTHATLQCDDESCVIVTVRQ